ncbi:MAG: hypothetical protein WC812_03055 [Candidatus Pacearchaeota archaeon]|jgi:hypothetical protein
MTKSQSIFKKYEIHYSLIDMIKKNSEDYYIDSEAVKAILKNQEFNFLNAISFELINQELSQKDTNSILDNYSSLKEFIPNKFFRKLIVVTDFINYLRCKSSL